MITSVPDLEKPESQCHLSEAQLTWGVRNLDWGGDEKGAVSLRATWDQGGQGRITPKEGFQVSKGE